ncbi:MAG: GlsB/YeaQ/YmgE family stress response membrane protein [Anaerolineales bacterium]|nr:GlsB/YeaQ/YmgE family stress response membrane protein [Anaerolineales bacterium]
MINIIVWIIAGALVGWVASLIMKTDKRQGPIADIVVGIVGAFVGGYILSPLFNVSTINEGNFSLSALLVSLGGAVILLAISRLFRNVGGLLVILLIVLIIFLYYSCWSMASPPAFCTSIRALLLQQ